MQRFAFATKEAVSNLVSRTNAITDWEATLIKRKNWDAHPIQTVELEKLWLQSRPILFIGRIKEIAPHDQSHYDVLLESTSIDHVYYSKLQLSLISDKNKIDLLLKENPRLIEVGINNGVAAIANIDSINTKYVVGNEGGIVVKIGEGQLIDMLNIDILILHSSASKLDDE